jgi:FkbM family methyltransferase
MRLTGLVRRRRRAGPYDALLRRRTPEALAWLAPTVGDLLKLCRAQANPVYLGANTALCSCFGLFKLYVDTRDRGFASNLLLDGYWEPSVTLLVAQAVRPGMTVIDVGANYGYHTLLLGWLVGDRGRVVAVEPNPEAAASLHRSVELNGAAARISVINAAAGDSDGGEALLFVPESEPKNATIVASPEAMGPAAGQVHSVPRVTLDRIAAELPRVDFIKIDAEGAEAAIIAGMRAMLLRDKPCLMLEFNAGRGADPGRMLDELSVIYGQLRYINDLGEPVAASRDYLLAERRGLDWLLCLGLD